MEVKINREIRNYTEAMFFGLSMRQFIFSACACVVAVGLYFLLQPYVGTETVSWMCILGAAPFAALGFIKYNGMTAEKFVWAWFKSEFLMPKKLTFRSTNTYYEMMKPGMEHKQKEVSKANLVISNIDTNMDRLNTTRAQYENKAFKCNGPIGYLQSSVNSLVHTIENWVN